MYYLLIATSQLTFTCSKSTIETLEKCVKYVQSQQNKKTEQRHWRRSGVSVTFELFTPSYGVSIIDFEQVNVSWVINSSLDVLPDNCKNNIIIV